MENRRRSERRSAALSVWIKDAEAGNEPKRPMSLAMAFRSSRTNLDLFDSTSSLRSSCLDLK